VYTYAICLLPVKESIKCYMINQPHLDLTSLSYHYVAMHMFTSRICFRLLWSVKRLYNCLYQTIIHITLTFLLMNSVLQPWHQLWTAMLDRGIPNVNIAVYVINKPILESVWKLFLLFTKQFYFYLHFEFKFIPINTIVVLATLGCKSIN